MQRADALASYRSLGKPTTKASISSDTTFKQSLTIGSHVHAHAMSWTIFHGSNRAKFAKKFECYDIVISTYHTVLAEWKRSASERIDVGQSMHSFSWHRIILDEGMDISILASLCF